MSRIRKTPHGNLFLDFRANGQRYREYTQLTDKPENRRYLSDLLASIDEAVEKDCFVYRRFLPVEKQILAAGDNLPMAEQQPSDQGYPSLAAFAQDWQALQAPRWKFSMQRTVNINLELHILPALGRYPVDAITRRDVLRFRLHLSRKTNDRGELLSNDRINHVMTTLRILLNEAAVEYGLSNPYEGVPQLRVDKPDVDPFSLEEVNQILAGVRPDFRDYFLVRFFTGLRTSEVDGLQWQYVDFARRHIRVRKTLVDGRIETPKTTHSKREVDMVPPVYDALRRQYQRTGEHYPFVFVNQVGNPLDRCCVRNRVWKPLLEELGLRYRRPYETRHTAATLWLAAGENPEWIARQLGHVDTTMLFRRYSRFVPNLTRRDGSAFEALLEAQLQLPD